jgi:tripartite-type tricarboxylate transporter receptor subunit TctC
MPDVAQRLNRDGLIPDPMSMPAFRSFIDSETARWTPVLHQVGLAGK